MSRKVKSMSKTILSIEVEKLTPKEILEQEKEDREEVKFQKSIKNPKIYKLLDEMIESLYEAGVDVSYFPLKAKKVLVKYSNKFSIDKPNKLEGKYLKEWDNLINGQLSERKKSGIGFPNVLSVREEHITADSILLKILDDLGFTKITDRFKGIDKWYN